MELFIRELVGQVLGDAHLGADNELFGVTLRGVVENGRGGAHKIGMFDDVRDALGVDQDRGAGMELFRGQDIFFRHSRVDVTAAEPEIDFFVRQLALNVVAEVAIRNEENFIFRHAGNNLDGGR